MRALFPLLTSVLLLAGCKGEEPVDEPVGCLPFLVPASFDFEDVEIGQTRFLSPSVGNGGDEDCTIAATSSTI